jgi:deoxyribodipyrimidine photo-lyase
MSLNDAGGERSRQLNDRAARTDGPVIYVMSRDQRVRDNAALTSAQQYAIERRLPLEVWFFLYPAVGPRALQHYQFMLDGLKEVEQRLHEHKVPFEVRLEKPVTSLEQSRPAAVFFDFSPLRGPRALRQAAAGSLTMPVFEVDTHNIVPARVVSERQEWAARTLRPKIQRALPTWLQEPSQLLEHPFPASNESLLARNDWGQIEARVRAKPLPDYTLPATAGEQAADSAARAFVEQRLTSYAARRNDPARDGLSNLSPYFHYGQLSSLRVALLLREAADAAPNDTDLQLSVRGYLEEVIVRKELSDNYCLYNPYYDHFAGLPEWGRKTLDKHRNDPREHRYSRDQLEQAETHDPAWNAAQRQMTRTGKLHGYMRMYWGKKILEWTASPEEAIAHAVYLNDRYELDGYDPNGYVGILWSIGGLHDRPWKERPIFGTVRYMNAAGLRRKFDLDAYVERWLAEPPPG